MSSDSSGLITEQLLHAVDMVRAELKMINHRLDNLEKQATDHENRLRMATDGVTQFKVWSGLAAGGSGILSLIAMIRTLFAWGE